MPLQCQHGRIKACICVAMVTVLVLFTAQNAWLESDYIPGKPVESLNSSALDRTLTSLVENPESVESIDMEITERARRKLLLLGRTDILNTSRQCEKRLPDCIIIGVMKAGTEAFSTFLGIHPNVAMQFNMRSTLYFTSNYNKGEDWYKSQMTCAQSDQVTMEKAPQYWASYAAPERIHQLNPNIKLILLVRNPIDRAVSHYLQVNSSNHDQIGNKTFEQMVFTSSNKIVNDSRFTRLSAYSVIYKHWLKYFKKSQILIIDGDSFKEDQIKSLSITEDFLGIEHFITRDSFVFNKEKGFYCLKSELADNGIACLSDGKGRKHPELGQKHMSKLKKYFRPYNEEFYKLTGYRYDW